MGRSFFKFFLLSVVLVSLPTQAQDTNKSPAGIPGCGAPSAKFKVKTSLDHSPVQPQPGKALVFFIQNDTNFNSFPKPTTRVGIDGKWVGATNRNSFLYFFVDPGVHHLCTSWQRQVITTRGVKDAAAHFTAKEGGVYYFQIKDTYLMADGGQIVDATLTPLDRDEGQLLANRFALATSQLKK
jgi:hypothetical protein